MRLTVTSPHPSHPPFVKTKRGFCKHPEKPLTVSTGTTAHQSRYRTLAHRRDEAYTLDGAVESVYSCWTLATTQFLDFHSSALSCMCQLRVAEVNRFGRPFSLSRAFLLCYYDFRFSTKTKAKRRRREKKNPTVNEKQIAVKRRSKRTTARMKYSNKGRCGR